MRNFPVSIILVAATLGALSATPGQAAQPASGANANRYIMTPANGGFVRMDTQTGALSFCSTSGGTLSCKLSEDDQIAITRDMEQLRKDNKELKEENRRLEDMLLGDNNSNSSSKRKPKFKLPSEKDVDQALGYIERMYKKFRDKIQELETNKRNGSGSNGGSGTGTPL